MMLRVLATLRDRQLMLFQPSPALVGFMRSTARRILVRAANRVGKTKHAAAKLATLMLERAGGRFRAVAVNYQQSIAVVGQYLANFLPADQLAPNCRFSLENGWTHQLIVLRNGTTCEIRSCEQAAISHAGSDLDGVFTLNVSGMYQNTSLTKNSKPHRQVALSEPWSKNDPRMACRRERSFE